ITPAVSANIGQAYTNDEIAIWIDYNNDFTFSATERVGYVLVGAGWSNQFTFTVPSTATTGAVRMRVRISYSVVADGGAPIDPCAVATYGETEDYTVNITQGGNVGLSELNENDVIIYPNPTNSNFVVEIPEVQNELVEIKLMDVFGRIITSKSIQKNNLKYEFSTNSISNGTYYVVIVSDLRTITKRVMKN
ncbi:MAG: hypothetical protein RLZ10_225, partial [Bacteroidota bacterium]